MGLRIHWGSGPFHRTDVSGLTDDINYRRKIFIIKSIRLNTPYAFLFFNMEIEL